MSIKPTLADAVNDQIRTEFQSAYQYLAMAAWFTENNLHGFAHWMKMQWTEEIQHALKLYTFLHNRGGSVELKALDAPIGTFESPLQCFQAVLIHEQTVTQRINELYSKAQAEHDLPLQVMLQWFINEQVEEEAQVSEVLDRLKLIGTDGPSIFLLDQQLGRRQATAESTEGA